MTEANSAVQDQIGLGLDNVAKYAAALNTEFGNYEGDALNSVMGGTPDLLDMANQAEDIGIKLEEEIIATISKISNVSDKALNALAEITLMREGARSLIDALYTQLRLLT